MCESQVSQFGTGRVTRTPFSPHGIPISGSLRTATAQQPSLGQPRRLVLRKISHLLKGHNNNGKLTFNHFLKSAAKRTPGGYFGRDKEKDALVSRSLPLRLPCRQH